MLKILELLPINHEHGDVTSVVVIINPDGDLGSQSTTPNLWLLVSCQLALTLAKKAIQGILPASQGHAVLLGCAQL